MFGLSPISTTPICALIFQVKLPKVIFVGLNFQVKQTDEINFQVQQVDRLNFQVRQNDNAVDFGEP